MNGNSTPSTTNSPLTERLDVSFALKAAQLGVWELDPVTKIINWDDRCRELFGLVKDNQLPYEQAIRYIHPDDVSRVDEAVRQAMNPRSDGYYDATYRTLGAADGVLRWVRFTGRSYFNTTGDVYRFAGIAMDVTEEIDAVMAQRKARESEMELAFAIDAAELGVWELNPQTNTVRGNARLKDWFGLQPDDEIPLSLAIDAIAKHDQLRVTEAIWQALQYESGGQYETEYTIVHPATGQERVVRAKGKAQFGPDQLVIRFNGTLQDITERKRAEEAQQASDAMFRALIQEAPIATMLLTGPDHVIELANERMIQMLGKGTAILGKPAIEAIPGLAAQSYLNLLNTVFASGEVYEAKAMPGELCMNGISATYYFDFTYKPIFDLSGAVYGILSMAVDVTEQVLARQRIEQSQQQLLALFEQSPVAIAIISEDNLTFRMTNPFYCELVGRSADQLVGKPLLEALPELRGQGFDVLLQNVFTTGIPFIAKEIPVDFVRNNQLETIYVDFTYQPHWGTAQADDKEVVSSVLVVCTDVTQQVRSRRQVEASETKMRSLIEAAPVAIGLFVGRDLIIDMPNKTFIDIVGKGPDIAGKPLREVMPELLTENQPFLQILDDVYTTGQPFQSFGSMVKIVQQGVMTHNYYNITYSPLRDETGEIYAILDVAVDVTGQILTQQELERQKTYLQNALAIADLGTFAVDVSTNTGTYSENIQRWFGLPSTMAPMEVIIDKVHPDDRHLVRKIINQAKGGNDETQHDFVYRVIGSSEDELVYLRSLGKMQDADGETKSIIGIIENVTAQIQARQAIEKSEQNLRSIVESAPFPIGVYVGREMRIQLANQSIIDVWGKGNDVIGKRYAEILPELKNQQIYEQLDRVYLTGVPFHAKNQRVDIVVDGVLQPFYFNYSFTPMYDASGQIYGVMNTAAEITDLVMAKQQVEEAEANLRAAVELAELVTWRLNIKQGTVSYSPRFMDWLGFSTDTATLDEAFNPVPDDYRKSVARALEATWQPGSSGFYDNEHPVVNRLTGQMRIIHAQARLVYDANGNPAFLNGTAQDVTEQRRVQQELERQVAERTQQLQMLVLDLERSNRNLQQFAYVASHDLQEPLRKIQSFGDLLKSQYAAQLGDGVDFLSRMQTASNRMSTLIKDLLTFSRISTQQEDATEVSLAEVANTTLSDLELTIQETGAVVEVGALPTILGDRSQLGQLFQNLISNALKFRRTTASGQPVTPVIRLEAEQVSANELPATVRPTRLATVYYRIDVADNGIGFDTKYLDRIFQVFQRLHGKSEFAGTGIGLAICEKVVANHGGAITATSQLGQGATFSIYLPV
ncbi:PAS domain S-box protein [Spirosoma montaniterrae]|uniref:histidine kinase n=1 Tax=Spirosoma montaniterrae TaxID=1178516 RepID=A0A1P9WWG3_9BACT|nr:PAS domain S-box protein [Spirosoma montaniterrae]AQG79732.1 hypothetical protein AWR27_10580 [Spirosoma montaniterrae]